MGREKKIHDIPNKCGNVWPEDCCPAYTARKGAIDILKGCWYCQYADFQLKEERALDIGICKWPDIIIK